MDDLDKFIEDQIEQDPLFEIKLLEALERRHRKLEKITIEGVFHIPGRGYCLSVRPPPQNPELFIGQILEHEGKKYKVNSWEGMSCLVWGCNCIRSVSFVCSEVKESDGQAD